jgi:hypothetical protein
VCDDNYEDTEHILFNCPLSTAVWRAAGLWGRVQSAVNSSTHTADAIFLLLQRLNDQDAAHMAGILWSLWKHRNMRLWQNVVETCAQILERALHLIEDWKHANNNNKPMQQAHDSSVTTAATMNHNIATNSSRRSDIVGTAWKKPASGRYKCNIDASFSSQRNRVGLGMCIVMMKVGLC